MLNQKQDLMLKLKQNKPKNSTFEDGITVTYKRSGKLSGWIYITERFLPQKYERSSDQLEITKRKHEWMSPAGGNVPKSQFRWAFSARYEDENYSIPIRSILKESLPGSLTMLWIYLRAKLIQKTNLSNKILTNSMQSMNLWKSAWQSWYRGRSYQNRGCQSWYRGRICKNPVWQRWYGGQIYRNRVWRSRFRSGSGRKPW